VKGEGKRTGVGSILLEDLPVEASSIHCPELVKVVIGTFHSTL
jgi:hypothetical protein